MKNQGYLFALIFMKSVYLHIDDCLSILSFVHLFQSGVFGFSFLVFYLYLHLTLYRTPRNYCKKMDKVSDARV